MMATAQERLAGVVKGRHVLAIQDTTVTRSGGGGGSYFHAMIAVDAESGALLGAVDARFLYRTQGRRASRRQRGFANRESARWLASAQAAMQACGSAGQVTVIADREADVFELFAERPAGADLLIRATHDRALNDGGKLFSRAGTWPCAGFAELDLPAIPGRRTRQARLAIRFGQVSVKATESCENHRNTSVPVTLIELREETPPAGAAPLHWRLLTTHEVETPMDALAIAGLYRRRWAIEELFRLMKRKGFDIEALSINDETPRNRLITAVFIAAVHVLQMVHSRDGNACPGKTAGQTLRPAADVFQPEDKPLLRALNTQLEGKTQRQKNPHPPDSLAYATWLCARLGGWTGYYGKPGPIVILNGWLEFQAIKRGVRLSEIVDV